MPSEIGTIGETFQTHATEGFLASMESYVSGKVRICAKTLLTNLARERLFVRVYLVVAG